MKIQLLFLVLFVFCFAETFCFNLPDECKGSYRIAAVHNECVNDYHRWYFDERAGKCSQFAGDCPQGSNNFETRSECEIRCLDQLGPPYYNKLDEKVCYIAMADKDCYPYTGVDPHGPPRPPIWFYNESTGICQRCASFSGRKNFENRFIDEGSCINTCVASPNIQARWNVRSCLLCQGSHVQCIAAPDFYSDAECRCQRGFQRRMFTNDCEDINECLHRELHHCPDPRDCRNTPGGYICLSSPQPGYPDKPWVPPTYYPGSDLTPAPFPKVPLYPPPASPYPYLGIKTPYPVTPFNPPMYYFPTTYKSPYYPNLYKPVATPSSYVPIYTPVPYVPKGTQPPYRPPYIPTPPPVYTRKPVYPPYLFTPPVYTTKPPKPFIPTPYIPPKVVVNTSRPYWPPTIPPYIPPPMVTKIPYPITHYPYWTTPRIYWPERPLRNYGGYRECEVRKLICDPNGNCSDVGGSFYCRCNDGFTIDGYRCNLMYPQPSPVDPYQCERFLGRRCSYNAECIFYWPNQYSCQCRFGFYGDGYFCHAAAVTPVVPVYPQPVVPEQPTPVAPVVPAEPTPANPVYPVIPVDPVYPTYPTNKPINITPDIQDCRYKRCDPYAVCKQAVNSAYCECMPGFAGNGDVCTQDRSACNDQFDERYRNQCGAYNFQKWFYLDQFSRQCKMFWFGTCAQAHGIFGRNIFSDEQTCVQMCNAAPIKDSWPQSQTVPVYPEISTQPVSYTAPATTPNPIQTPAPYPYPIPAPRIPNPMPAPTPYPYPPKYPLTPIPYRPVTVYPYRPRTPYPYKPVTPYPHRPLTPYPYRPLTPRYPQPVPPTPDRPMPPVASQLPGVCSQPCQPGPCNHVAVMYYFNPNSGQCQPFVYSGCGGNENKFSSLAFCQVTCQAAGGQVGNGQVSNKVCLMRLDQGYGRGDNLCDSQSKYFYYFNYQTRRCEPFFYYGCGGNSNRFTNEFDCQRMCLGGPGFPMQPPSWKQPVPLQAWTQPSIYPYPQLPVYPNPGQHTTNCHDQSDMGPCRNLVHKWFFNVRSQRCEQFTYGGCYGNGNRFDTQSHCELVCRGLDLCTLPIAVGTCNQPEQRFYYDPATRNCYPFEYTGCGGNANNFYTYSECKSRCTRKKF